MYKQLIGIMSVGLWLAVTNAQAVLIDSFNVTTQAINIATPSLGLTAPEAIGSFRQMALLEVMPFVPGFEETSLEANVGNTMFLDLTANIFVTSVTYALTWDAQGAGLGGVDLTTAGADTFVFDILSVNGVANLSLTVTDTSNNTATQDFFNVGVGEQSALFSSFAPVVDFTAVDFIALQIAASASDGPQIALDLIETRDVISGVPEPGTIALVGTGLIILGLVGFRRQQRGQAL